MIRVAEDLTLLAMSEYESFLISKKIDPVRFKKGDPDRFTQFEGLFAQIHPESLVAQKLFLINSIRRKFPLKTETALPVDKAKSNKMKPKITPKIKK